MSVRPGRAAVLSAPGAGQASFNCRRTVGRCKTEGTAKLLAASLNKQTYKRVYH